MSYVVEIYESDIPWLAYAAGIAQGANNANASAALMGIINRLSYVSDSVPAHETLTDEDVAILAEQMDRDSAEANREIQPEEAAAMSYQPYNPQDAFGAGPPGKNVR